MSNPVIKLVNAETGAEVERPMSAVEFKQYEAEQQALAHKLTERQASATAKAALLTKLGITADEAALLLS